MKKRKISTEKILLFLLVLLAILGPVLSPYTYDGQDVTARNLGMSWIHWFGTDKFGRDLFTRVCCGIRLSLLIGAISAMICGGIGTLIGGAAGYIGGKTDLVLSELMNILSAVPSLLYIILIQLAFHPGMGSVILGFCVAGWVDLARFFRATDATERDGILYGGKNDGCFLFPDNWKIYFAKCQTVIESADAFAGSQSDIYGSFSELSRNWNCGTTGEPWNPDPGCKGTDYVISAADGISGCDSDFAVSFLTGDYYKRAEAIRK